MDESSALKPDPPPPNPRRRNSITVPVAVPSTLNLFAATKSSFGGAAASPPLPLAFELLPIKSSSSSSPSPSLVYTSLRDILPSATANSPSTASAANSSYEISIRNRLVKQAAWAYLQPMSSSPGSSGPHLLRRLWLGFSTCLSFLNLRIISSITQAFDRIFRAVGVSFVN